MFAYVGSFNYSGSEGIHICDYDPETGTLTYRKTVMPQVNPGNLCVYKDLLMTTDECMDGKIYIFRIDPETGELEEIKAVSTPGVNPSYITIDSGEKYAIVTHFSIAPPVRRIEKKENGEFEVKVIGNDSPTCLYELDEQQGIGELKDISVHRLSESPLTMIHKAYENPEHTLFAENDLGGNRIYFFKVTEGKFEFVSSVSVDDHNPGPRHGAFHPTRPYLYINYEHKSKVTKLDLTDIQNIRVTEELELFSGEEKLEDGDNQSELMFHPNGKLLYNFMRGKGIAYVIGIDETDGSMHLVQKFMLPGPDPRGAFFSPDKRFILVEGHNSGAVYTIRIEEDGTLSYNGQECRMAHPACIGFYAV